MFFAERKLKREMVQTIKMLNEQLESSNKFIVSLQNELALERAKAVSRNDFIASGFIGVDWDKDTYEKASCFDSILTNMCLFDANEIDEVDCLDRISEQVYKVANNLKIHRGES